MKEKKSTTEQIVDKMLESIETTNKLPWNAGWVTGGLPVNLTTGKRYNGVNILMLWSRGFNKPLFATYKQIGEKGGQVKKGEKGTPIIYYNFVDRLETNEKTGDEEVKQIPFAKLSYVFNISQTDGIVEMEVTGEHKDAETFISKLPARIIHGYDPCYALNSDEVRIPLRGDVESEERYYSILFHELIHWTGAKGRMNREMSRKIEEYSFEELVAEIGSAFLMAEFGLKPCDEQNAAYVKGWASRINSDKSMILKAASQASKAMEFLLSFSKDDGAAGSA